MTRDEFDTMASTLDELGKLSARAAVELRKGEPSLERVSGLLSRHGQLSFALSGTLNVWFQQRVAEIGERN